MRVTWEDGRLVMEVQATIRIPISFVLDDMETAMPRLTKREAETLQGIVRRKSNKDLAAQLGICERTVKAHVSTLLEKFHLHSRLDLRELVLRRDVSTAKEDQRGE